MEERNVDAMRGEGGGGGGGSPKQGLTSAEDLTIEFPEHKEFSYHRLD